MSFINQTRHIVIIYLIIAAVLILTIKLAQLQLFPNKYSKKAEKLTLTAHSIYPSRGLIYDRNDKLLVVNNPVYSIEVIYNQVDKNMDTMKICRLLNIDKSTFIENIEKDWKNPQFHKSIPFRFISRIKPEDYASLQEHLHEFPGFYPTVKNIRTYPHENAAHVLGYLGEVSKRDIAKDKKRYSLGDYIGKSGIEKIYETALRGTKGVRFVLKDNLGREKGAVSDGSLDVNATSGTDIISSLDLDLQAYGEKLMRGKRGSIVAIEPNTGEILSMISSPSYDPNILKLDKDRGDAYTALLKDTINKPIFDRSVMAKYPPGSIFKPILSLIALQEGITSPNRKIDCYGEYQYKTFTYDCHNHPVPYNISTAIQYSCNTYFFTLFRELLEVNGYSRPGEGLDLLDSYLYKFGLGARLGVDQLHEKNGFVPNSKYYDKMYNTKYYTWKSTYVISMGIGQGELQLTTVQMANLAVILANRGYFYTPHIIKNYSGDAEVDPKFNIKHTVPIDKQHFIPVIEGMSDVVTQGTGVSAYSFGLDVCGKTGTSQNPHGKDHSVFFAFAPKDDPKIAIAVYVENGGYGATVASPIAGLMIEQYLNKSISPRKKYLENRIFEMEIPVVPVKN